MEIRCYCDRVRGKLAFVALRNITVYQCLFN